jgi:hypothetical protein
VSNYMPPQPPMGAPAGPPLPYAPPPRPKRGTATTGLVLGIVAVVFAFIPGLLYVGFILGVLALVFGIMSLRRGIGRGIASTILGGFGIVLSLVFAVVYGMDGSTASTPTASDAAAATQASKSPAPTTTTTVPSVVGMTVAEAESELESQGLEADAQGADDDAKVASQSPVAGGTIADGTTVTLEAADTSGASADSAAAAGTKFSMTNTNRIDGSTADYTEWIDSYNDNFVPSNEYEAADAGKKFVVVTIHVNATTAGVDAGSLTYDVALSDPDGNVYESQSYLDGLDEMPSVTLGAGQSAQGQVAFEVPNTFHGGILSFGDGSVFVKTS